MIKNHIWHPFDAPYSDSKKIHISKAYGSYLYDNNGNKYLDMTSNWWSDIHGYSNEYIANAISKQAKTLCHIRLSDMIHSGAIALSKSIINLMPKNMDKIFFSESGSSAIEVALKIAMQYFYIKKEKNKTKIVAFNKGFHGETFGSMSLGKKTKFFNPFIKNLFSVIFIEYPETWIDDSNVEKKENTALEKTEKMLKKEHEKIAAIVIEPIIQGASGMRLARASFIEKIVLLFKKYNIIVIYDEVMTGFGRLGTMFAMDMIAEKPDIICIGKAFSGGTIPISATIVTKNICNTFGSNFSLAHGHTYSANPICCAAAISSIELFSKNQTIKKIKEIENWHNEQIKTIQEIKDVYKIRVIGSIMAFSIKGLIKNKANLLKNALYKQRILIRPLGNNIYIMPNSTISYSELCNVYSSIKNTLKEISKEKQTSSTIKVWHC